MVDPKQVGMSEELLARIRPAMEKHIGATKLSGAVTLIHRGGELVYLDAIGTLDRERQLAMRDDAIFRIYSMTKPVTCVALMMLYEQGCFQLSDPVSKYIPSYRYLKVHSSGTMSGQLEPVHRQVTVHDLLTHTSGMTYSFSSYGPVEALYREERVFADQPLEQLANDLASLPLAFQPGSQWRYSVSQDVAAHLVQVLSGMAFDEFLQTNLFAPLGMVDTGFFVPAEKHERFAAMYGVRDCCDGEGIALDITAQANAGVNNLLADPRDCRESKPHNVLRGGIGLVSTAGDYLRFCRMLLSNGTFEGQRLLSRKTVELMTCNHIVESLLPIPFEDGPKSGFGYGLGFGVLMDVGQPKALGSVGEFNWSGAATTSFWIDPREALIGIQMAQFQPSGFHLIAEDFKTMTYQAIVD